jgi:hypothetical protein
MFVTYATSHPMGILRQILEHLQFTEHVILLR